MVEIKFSRLKKECQACADDLMVDQELLLLFLNSPIREKIMKFSKLNKNDKNVIQEFVDYYAKLKIELEKKKKPETENDVRNIEIGILKNIFNAEILGFKNLKRKEALEIARKIIKVGYPDSVVLEMLEIDKIATLTGIDTSKEFPSEFLIFDIKNKKIIGIGIKLK